MGLQPFYRALDAPRDPSFLPRDREEARQAPCADIQLALCPQCGLISNAAWTPPEPDQAAPSCFSRYHSDIYARFAEDLAREWVQRFDLRERRIIEIGSGNGEFLSLLCESGDNEGIGIDPLSDSSRLPISARSRIRVISEPFSLYHSTLEPDAIVCRHTLEHVHDVTEFLQTIREAVRPRKDIPILFQVRNASFILRESAFWDIHYDHSALFCESPLRFAFTRAGFDVQDIRPAFFGQYLALTAFPGKTAKPQTPPSPDEVESVYADVERFAESIPELIEVWHTRIQGYVQAGRRIVIWGASTKAVSFCTALGLQDEVACVIDINPNKWKSYLPWSGIPVKSPDHLIDAPPDLVLAMNPAYSTEITASLALMGLQPQVISVSS